jgi:hypothetical protein
LIQNHWPVSESILRLHYDSELFFDLLIDEENLRPPSSKPPRLSWLDMLLVKWRIKTPKNLIKKQGLLLKQFTDFQNDPKCIASVQHHNEQVEKLKHRLSEVRRA